MERFRRIFVIVVDSCGIGGASDAADFGDPGADTLGHISEHVGTFLIPNLVKLGLANIKPMKGTEPPEAPAGLCCRMAERSRGKDTTTGHWEMMGLETTKPFITFTEHGFPPELIHELEEQCGKKIIGNKAASGTEILDELGEQEISEGRMIVYTSADSVLQICGNEETFDLKNLYRCCEIARKITLKDEWKVGRVIARPYVGKHKGEFRRTSNRRDYSVDPFGKTALNVLAENGLSVISIGKISDIFNANGITEAYHSIDSVNGMEQTIDEVRKDGWKGLCFTNLVDFDALWGHRRNVEGYAQELVRFDVKLGEFLREMKQDDLVMITADHGNDPTWTGTDHTRENVPLLLYSPSMKRGGELPAADTFAVIGATVTDNFGLSMPEGTIGTSLLSRISESTS